MNNSIIDIGTNSIRLLVYGDKEKLGETSKEIIITRIGEGVDANRVISKEAMERTVSGLKELKGSSEGEVRAFATSAVRDAANRSEFIEMAKDVAGLDVEVISGEEEAELAFLGARMGFSSDHIFVIDIGGGSTELIVGKGDSISYKTSLDIGAVRLREMEARGLDRKEVLDGLLDIEIDIPKGCRAIGIGGTATTAGAIDQYLEEYSRGKIQGYTLTPERIGEIYSELSDMTLKERKSVVGLSEKRADIIVQGLYILIRVLERFGFKELSLSDYDNLEGYLEKHIFSLTKD